MTVAQVEAHVRGDLTKQRGRKGGETSQVGNGSQIRPGPSGINPSIPVEELLRTGIKGKQEKEMRGEDL